VGNTVTVAVVLSFAAAGRRPRQDANQRRAQRAAILETVMDIDPETLESDYAAYITERVFDAAGGPLEIAAIDVNLAREVRKSPADRAFPVYVFERQGTVSYIVPIRGAGLWGPISAFVALASDLDTITGVSFDHEKETPGLGAEITTPAFERQFEGKNLYDGGDFASVRVVKSGGTTSNPHAVDGLTGATMTMNGVTDMFAEELSLYLPIFEELGS
jgi:Na+-transporting NADH:ubiquinone oxidoreductase subunit C